MLVEYYFKLNILKKTNNIKVDILNKKVKL